MDPHWQEGEGLYCENLSVLKMREKQIKEINIEFVTQVKLRL
jgi:hypothetical protein